MSATQYHTGQFPPNDINWQKLVSLIGSAHAAVARYDGSMSGIANVSVLLSPLVTQEAVLSSRIEGTQTEFEEVLRFEVSGAEKGQTEQKQADIIEVINYRKALYEAVELLKTLPLSQRLLKQAHKTLMSGVRGQSKDPGEYKKLPNFIGKRGGSIESARFIPLAPNLVPEAMTAWEKYIHAEAPDKLVQLAILHAEFEAIHPFNDGNGRLGRMFVPLFMFEKKLLSRPMFYISAYLEANRDEYIERLRRVSSDGDWIGWCEFFLKAIIGQAEANQRKVNAILALYQEKKEWITVLTHSHFAIKALDQFFSKPIFTTSDFIEKSGIPPESARRILRLAQKSGVLKTFQESRGRLPAILAFRELLNIAEGDEVF